MNEQLVGMSEYEKQVRIEAIANALNGLSIDSALGFLAAMTVGAIVQLEDPTERHLTAHQINEYINGELDKLDRIPVSDVDTGEQPDA